jgi:enolase
MIAPCGRRCDSHHGGSVLDRQALMAVSVIERRAAAALLKIQAFKYSGNRFFFSSHISALQFSVSS